VKGCGIRGPQDKRAIVDKIFGFYFELELVDFIFTVQKS
jgi:hypothetical protein